MPIFVKKTHFLQNADFCKNANFTVFLQKRRFSQNATFLSIFRKKCQFLQNASV
jgi:hypothetical protein